MFNTGRLVRLARQYRGIDQKTLVGKVGLNAAGLSRIENGALDVPAELKARIAKALDFPASFFDQTHAVHGHPISMHAPLWRKKANVPATETGRIIAEANIRTFHLRALLEAAAIQARLKLPTFDVETHGGPVEVARLLRRHWMLPSGPVFNLVRLVEDAGIVVARTDMAGSQISGVTFWVPGLPPLVMLNKDDPGDRQRLTLAHELGHIVMHFTCPTADLEQEAWDFASEFMAPSDELRASIGSRPVNLRTLASLKKEWRLSMASLLMGCLKAGAIESTSAKYLWIELGRRGYRLREPPELDCAVEPTTVVDDLVAAHVNELGFSHADVCRMFAMQQDDVTKLYDTFAPPVQAARPKLWVVR